MRNIILVALNGILVASIIIPVYAADLNSELSTTGVAEKPAFKFLETVFFDYQNGGQLKDLLKGKNVTISFDTDSSNPSVQNLMNRINSNLVYNLKSTVIVTGLKINYTASLVGYDSSATIDYKITMVPTITNYVLVKGSGSNPTIIDSSWMGISIAGPVEITTEKYRSLDINSPASFVQKQVPDLYSKILGTKAEEVLKNSLIDAGPIIQQPLGSWNHLFDPAYLISETKSWGYKGQKVPITTFTMGESSLVKTANPTINDVDFRLDKNYHLQTVQHASSATIQIDGFVTTKNIGNQTYFSTTPISQGPPTEPGFPVGVIYSMAAFGAIVAGGVFLWSNKKLKAAQDSQIRTKTQSQSTSNKRSPI
jgi:hypothetical protein